METSGSANEISELSCFHVNYLPDKFNRSMNCPVVPENRPPHINKFLLPLANKKEDTNIIMNDSVEGPSFGELVLQTAPLAEPISLDENMPINDDKEIDESVEIEQGIIGNRKCEDKVADNKDINVIYDNSKKCDTLTDTINEELKDGLNNLSISSKEPPIERSSTELNSVSEPIIKGDGDISATERTDKESCDTNNKVIFVNTEGDTKEDDDLHLFNSHNYWYIIPDLPLNPSIIAGEQFPDNENASMDIAVLRFISLNLGCNFSRSLYYIVKERVIQDDAHINTQANEVEFDRLCCVTARRAL
ncbi:hypothetical protein NQ317_014157 [Molorchus minor]|uniref:Uncharacterized protein n=1 Tax=Molorchus minor TaxID=1323400 RepID=A0ABQ9JEH5_9CUCU|nr:hypothetical protein NQ317_014157 [Molorchus minor]